MMGSTNPNSLPIGSTLLWFEIRAVLGQGGFGITYLAHDTNLDQAVALKEYLPSLFATRGADLRIAPTSSAQQADFDWGLQRFIEEGRVLARFDHPAIVRVHSVFEANNTAYLVMRYEQGETLEALLKREKRLAEVRLRALFEDLLPGLEALHVAGFIHRDIKPGNIYLRRDGHALLIDFGAARQALNSQTQTVTSLVSPGYAPFEQYRSDGSAQGPWTDIYALGATAYRAITGRAPMPAVDRSHRILDGDADAMPTLTTAGLADYSWSLLAAIDRALAFRAADRPQTIAAWRDMLASDEPATAPNPAAAQGTATTALPVTELLPAEDSAAATVVTQPITARSTVGAEISRAPPKLIARPRRAWWMIAAGIVIATGLSLVGVRESTTRARSVFVVPPASDNRDTAEFSIAGTDSTVRSGTLPSVNPIPGLLAAAEADFAALRLSTPKGNNALEMYREVLQLEPTNRTAHDGIDRIVARYVDLAAAASRRDDFGSAHDYLKIAARIEPGDPRVQAGMLALDRDENAARTRTTASTKADQPSGSALSDAYDSYIVRPTRRSVAKVRRAWRKNRDRN